MGQVVSVIRRTDQPRTLGDKAQAALIRQQAWGVKIEVQRSG
jgi:hypothetical protein